MLLGKSCHAKDHIRKRNTLKLGSLHDYQETEIQEIADGEEGTVKFEIKFEGRVVVERRWFNTIFGGAFQFEYDAPGEREDVAYYTGGFRLAFDHFHCERVAKGKVAIIDSSISVTTSAPNCFIFCMSSVHNKSDCHGMFAQYNDYWYLDHSHAELFGRTISELLFEKIKDQHRVENYIVPKNTDMDSLEVYLSGGNVFYMEREIVINNSNSSEFQVLVERLHYMQFVKPADPFAKEKEFRFHYTIVSNNKIVVPLVKSVIIDAEKLIPFVL